LRSHPPHSNNHHLLPLKWCCCLQLAFSDTPGILEPQYKMQVGMMGAVRSAVSENENPTQSPALLSGRGERKAEAEKLSLVKGLGSGGGGLKVSQKWFERVLSLGLKGALNTGAWRGGRWKEESVGRRCC
jgi:hypothetical protein